MAAGITPGDLSKMADNRSGRWAAVCRFYAGDRSAQRIFLGCSSLCSVPGCPDDHQNTPPLWRPRRTAPFPRCPPGRSNMALCSAHFRSAAAQAQSGSGGRHFVTGRLEAEGAAGPRFRVRRAEAAAAVRSGEWGCGGTAGRGGRVGRRGAAPVLGKERRVGVQPWGLAGGARGAAYAEAPPSLQRPGAGPPCAPGAGLGCAAAAGGGGRTRPANGLPVPPLPRRPPDGRTDGRGPALPRAVPRAVTPRAAGQHRAPRTAGGRESRCVRGAARRAPCCPAGPRPVLPEPSSLLSRPHGRRCPLTPCPVMPNVRGPLVARRGRCELPPAPQLTLIGCSPPRCSSQVRRGGVVASPGRLEAEVLHGSHFHALQRSRCPLQACLEGCRRPKAAPLYLWQTWLCCTACLGCPGLPCTLLWVLLPCCCRPQRIRSGLSACPAGTCSAGHIAVSRAAFTARLLGWFVLAERLLSLRCSSTAAPQSLWVQLPVCTLPEHSGCGTGLPPGTRAPPAP